MGRRGTMAVVWLSGWLLATEAHAQATTSEQDAYWSADVSVSAMLSPGFGESATAVGGAGSFSLVRSRHMPVELRTRCVGARVTFAQEWSNVGAAAGTSGEQWLVAGPVWEVHDETEAAFISLHPFAGMKRSWPSPVDVGGSDVSSPAFGVRLSMGLGIAPIGGNEAAVRFFDITYLIAPQDPALRHRLVMSFGLDISRRLRR